MAARKEKSPKASRSTGSVKRSKARSAPRSASERGVTTRAVTRAMTAAQRAKLLAPPDRYDEIAADLVDAWAADRSLRVPSLTLTRLRALSAAADRARAREIALRAEMERRLALASDARLRAENDLWRAVLDVNAAVKAHARSDAAILDRFAVLDALVTRRVPAVVVPPARRRVVV